MKYVSQTQKSTTRVLLVYPEYPVTFWSFKHSLKFLSKKAAFPPLGLLTVGAMLPAEWEKKLIDMNISPLKDRDIEWADYVFISAMIVQKDSVTQVIRRCRELGRKVVAGGPLFNTSHDEFEGVDHFVLGEAEVTLPQFIGDLKNGAAKPLYRAHAFPEISATPPPLWDLVNVHDYASMSVQYSRGCPFNCEFCDIIIMNGRVPRTKKNSQVLRELDMIYARGWRGPVFIVDDNFIGKKEHVKKLLHEIIEWMRIHKNPFNFFTEASINLADDEELLTLMSKAGFQRVFVGIETPVDESLEECRKFQNKGRDLVSQVKKIQSYGLEVLGGFIVGFDSDPPSVFDKQLKFIQNSGVVVAMVGILTALPGTRLYNRLKEENRLLKGSSGNNVDGSINFIPRMDSRVLIEGYKKLLSSIYSPREYYERVMTFLKGYRIRMSPKVQWIDIQALIKSFWYLGITGNSQKYYWKLLAWSLVCRPRLFPVAVSMAIYGYHFQRIIQQG